MIGVAKFAAVPVVYQELIGMIEQSNSGAPEGIVGLPVENPLSGENLASDRIHKALHFVPSRDPIASAGRFLFQCHFLTVLRFTG